MDKTGILQRIAALPGDVGFYFKDLVSGESFGHRENEMFEAASVIKFPMYAVIMNLAAQGKVDLAERIVCREEDK